MSTANRLPKKIWKLPHQWLKGVMTWLLRVVFIAHRPARFAKAGFVLPTVILLLLMVALTVTALTVRALSGSKQVIAERAQQVVVNAASPAIDRAKAKLEYLFTADDRFPGGIPSSDVLATMLLAKTTAIGVQGLADDIYTLPDETRVDINGVSGLDNAWTFTTNVDGKPRVVAYSILVDDENGKKLTDPLSMDKAKALVTRNGPINTLEAASGCASSRAPEGGWQVVSSSSVEKNFQVDAFVLEDQANDLNRSVATLEFQQVRQADRGNKWGAWFRYDMEITAGGDFNWNGAMHTEGNMFVGDKVNGYLISSPSSCLYTRPASEVTLRHVDSNSNGQVDSGEFQGQFVTGKMAVVRTSGTVTNYDTRGQYTRTSNDILMYPYDATNPGSTANKSSARVDLTRDSVTFPGTSGTIQDIALDPIKVYTEDTNAHINASTWTRDTTWATRDVVTKGRIIPISKDTRPYVDDSFRADDRWGPKPRYNNEFDLAGNNIGTEITGNSALTAEYKDDAAYGLDGYWERRAIGQGLRLIVGQRLALGNYMGWNYVGGTYGLNTDPMYSPTADPTTIYSGANPGAAAKHRIRQYRSMRDNLAAVQGMVVYHANHANTGEFPLACMAVTDHPGTFTTRQDSRTFYSVFGENITDTTKSTKKFNVDFLTGHGTNGWEFGYNADSTNGFETETKFAAAIASSKPLGKALRNLANFAGDPKGGAPTFEPVQDSDVHPYPELAMWGDFSVLRRILAKVDGGTSYSNLSPADRSTLHSAACTLSMLGYSLNRQQDILNAILADSKVNWTNLGTNLTSLADNNVLNSGNPIIGRPTNGTNLCTTTGVTGCPTTAPWSVSATDTSNPDHPLNYFSKFAPDEWINALLNAGKIDSSQAATLRVLITGVQILRDRTLGFATGTFTGDVGSNAFGTYDVATGIFSPSETISGQIKSGAQLKLSCDPEWFSGTALDASSNSKKGKMGLALVACPYNGQPKYPSLYYLFPKVKHDIDGNGTSAGSVSPAYFTAHNQPTTERYVQNVTAYNGGNAAALVFNVVNDSDADDIESGTENGPAAIAAVPRYIGATPATGGWVTPAVMSNSTTDLDAAALNALATQSDRPDILALEGTNLDPATPVFKRTKLAFMGSSLFDGRERLSTRVLNMDIGMLASGTVPGGTDKWIPVDDGIVYVFREDAVREDEIVRPTAASTTWADCDTFAEITAAGAVNNCQMKVGATNQDPPLKPDSKISIKPVDFLPDPDRRPHGFRLINGATLKRASTQLEGMTLVTDNSVYIQGNFNVHTTATDGSLGSSYANVLEEFQASGSIKRLIDTTTQAEFDTSFYGRNTLEPKFADPAFDQWRPVEIFADAVTILSDNFKDGQVEDGFILETAQSFGSATSSYQNWERPYFFTGHASLLPADYQSDDWPHEDPSSTLSPIVIRQDGSFRKFNNSSPRALINPPRLLHPEGDVNPHRYNNIKAVGSAVASNKSEVVVNALLISNTQPARAGQGNGGLHNFPRLLEYWVAESAGTGNQLVNTRLIISGGFFQLGFSTGSTGLFDPDVWEPDDALTTTVDDEVNPISELNLYYKEADRLWGYDVALQYAPAGPISRRFVEVNRPRSEYYREISVDDPYITLLRCAKDASGNRVDPKATGCPA